MEVPPLLITIAPAPAASREPLSTGDVKQSLCWEGRASATGVNCEQNETCSRAGKLEAAVLKASPHPPLKVPLLLDLVALDDDNVLLPAAAAAATAAARVMLGLEDGKA